jgi:hypothetical protein
MIARLDMEKRAQRHFESVYRQWDTEEIVRLLTGDLESEAREAAQTVLKERGETYRATDSTPVSSEQVHAEAQDAARALWNGGLVRLAQSACAVSAITAAKPLVAGAGALVAASFAVAVGALGWYCGKSLARSICKSEAAALDQKRFRLYGLTVSAFVGGVLLHAVLLGLLR